MPAECIMYYRRPLYYSIRMQELGLDCVAWAPAVYHDLLRSGDGTAEGIVAAYFGMVSAAPSYSHCAVQTSAFPLS